MKTPSLEAQVELQRIAQRHGGLLRPPDVVAAARPEASPLHPYFEWDNGKAAEAYRLAQARDLIAVSVVVTKETGVNRRVWVSLSSDRYAEGGYRPLVNVLANEELRSVLLHDALQDFGTVADRYRDLRELEPLFRMVRKLQIQYQQPEVQATGH